LTEIAHTGVTVEINTSGYRHPELPVPQPYPGLPIIRQAHALGIPLMVNSDAHAPEQVGLQFGELEQFLRRTGCRELVRFEARQRITYAL
jgi:histidinol-phosphatase (PHP family)